MSEDVTPNGTERDEERDHGENFLDELEELEDSVEAHKAKSRVRESMRLARRIDRQCSGCSHADSSASPASLR